MKSDVSWLQRHERLIIAVLVIGAVLVLVTHWLNNAASDDKQKVAVEVEQLTAQKSVNAQLAQQVQQSAAQYQAMVDTLTRQNAALASAVSSRQASLVVQQKSDLSLPLPDLAQRWQVLTGMDSGQLKATADGISVTDDGARRTVADLEQVPVLAGNLRDTQIIVDNQKQELSKADGLIVDLNMQVSGLKLQMTDADSACKAQLVASKAEARKGKLKWFKAGAVVGFVGGLIAGHYIP